MTTLNLATAIRLGSAQVSRVYLGATQVWPAAVMPPAEIPPVIWDVTRKGVAMTVDGLQMSQTNQGTVAATMSVDAATANRYAEFHIDAYSGTDVGVGIIREDCTDYENWAGGAAGMVGCWENGSIDDLSGASSTETAGYARFNAGDTVALLLKRGKLYFGIVSGSSVTWWNSGNPAAETGYVASGLTGRWALCASMYAQGTYSCTLNVGDSTFAATPPAGAVGWKWAPTLGAHTMLKSPDGLTPNPPSTAAIATKNPTNIFVSRGASALITVPPTDNKNNTYQNLGSPVDYNGYAGEWNARNFWMQGTGDPALVLTLDNSAAINREVTMEVAEVVATPWGAIPTPTVAFTYASSGSSLVGPTIHVQGPALLVAVWTGDGGVYDMTAVPDANWTVIDSYLSLPPQSGVQYAVAVRDVTTAGDYSVTWATNPAQGSPLWIFAFPATAPVPKVELDISTLPSTWKVGAAFSKTVTATNAGGATGAITITAPSLPPGLSISATTGSGPYTATISGTPTTEAAAADFVISASNGTQSASADWNVAVNAAASSGVTVYTAYSGRTGGSSQSSTTINTTLSVEPGDTVVVLFSQNTATAVASVVDADGTFAARKFEPMAGGRNGSAGCFDHVVTSARSNYSVTVNTGTSISELFVQVYVLRGGPFTYLSGSEAGGSNDYADSPVSMAMNTPGAAVVLSCATDWYGGQGAFTISPATYTVDTNATSGDGFIAAHNISTGAVADTIVIDNPGNSQGGYNRITAIAVAYSY